MLTGPFGRIICISLLLALRAAAAAAEPPVCAECGMPVDREAAFTAKIVAGSQEQFFCDIGDLLIHLRGRRTSAGTAMVKDHPTGAWIGAADAFFVHEPRRFTTPMGWSIAAFRERGSAERHGTPADLAGIMKRITR